MILLLALLAAAAFAGLVIWADVKAEAAQERWWAAYRDRMRP